MTEYLFYNCIR